MSLFTDLNVSERRGALWIAIIALAITAIGFWLSLNYNSQDEADPIDIEIISTSNSEIVDNDKNGTSNGKKSDNKKSSKKNSDKSKKSYRQRNPLDEEVRVLSL